MPLWQTPIHQACCQFLPATLGQSPSPVESFTHASKVKAPVGLRDGW